MNETCKDCGKPVYWIKGIDRWYHDSLWDVIQCPASAVEPAGVTA